ncbi:MAG: flagellar type III secretion system pore protein FliP [Eubacteriales bacterium]
MKISDLCKLFKNWNMARVAVIITSILLVACLGASSTYAAPAGVSVAMNGNGSDVVKIIMIMTLITLGPSVLLMMTCFTRIIIVFSFLRSALGLQQSPPNQVLVGLALFVTFFIMSPVINQINETALKPYNAGTIQTQEFLERASVPLKEFMLKQTTSDEVELFKNLSPNPSQKNATKEQLSMEVVIPSFIVSELKRAFIIGFLIFIPFLVIDMIVASTLMSMGMIMLPPVMISLPFKIMLFVVVDGWGLLIKTLIMTYN